MTSFRSDPRDTGGLCPDDARLIERLGGNDETEARLAWTVLRARTDDRLVRVADYFLRSPTDARALVADVYVDLWERRRHLTIRKSLGGYLDQLVANRARTLLRTWNRRWRR
jgi:DNA-directed RNA polymerase specialized sigma24 family protein